MYRLTVQASTADQVRKELEGICSCDNIDSARFGVRLPGVLRLDRRYFIVSLSEELNRFQKDTGAGDGWALGPGMEGFLSRSDGGIDVGMGG